MLKIVTQLVFQRLVLVVISAEKLLNIRERVLVDNQG